MVPLPSVFSGPFSLTHSTGLSGSCCFLCPKSPDSSLPASSNTGTSWLSTCFFSVLLESGLLASSSFADLLTRSALSTLSGGGAAGDLRSLSLVGSPPPLSRDFTLAISSPAVLLLSERFIILLTGCEGDKGPKARRNKYFKSLVLQFGILKSTLDTIKWNLFFRNIKKPHLLISQDTVYLQRIERVS